MTTVVTRLLKRKVTTILQKNSACSRQNMTNLGKTFRPGSSRIPPNFLLVPFTPVKEVLIQGHGLDIDLAPPQEDGLLCWLKTDVANLEYKKQGLSRVSVGMNRRKYLRCFSVLGDRRGTGRAQTGRQTPPCSSASCEGGSCPPCKCNC